MTTCVDETRRNGEGSNSSDDDETWALELEEELLATTTNSASPPPRSSSDRSPSVTVSPVVSPPSEPTPLLSDTPRPPPSPYANDLPQEVLINIVGFTPVGRVSKAWSLAGSTLARRKFLMRLADTLSPFTPNATSIAQDIEAELFAAFGQSYSLPKSYGQKARQLLFNLKDARNTALRERLFTGELSAAALVRMSASDMANPQLVQQREQWIKKRTHEVMRYTRELDGFTQTELFECRSCGSHRTCYRQWRRKAIVDRTRVIVVCRDCPSRWEL